MALFSRRYVHKPLIALVFSFGLGAIIPFYVELYFGINLALQIDNSFFRFIFLVLLYDFLAYWRHRLSHEIKWWWEIHKFHHSAEEFNIITGKRVHPFDIALDRIFTCLPIAILGGFVEEYL